jgi:hypothetical protein
VDIHWVPPPPSDESVIFTVLLGDPETPEPQWPGARSMGTKLVHQEDLGTGERLWVTWHREPTLGLDEVRRVLEPTIREMVAETVDEDGSRLEVCDPRLRAMGMGPGAVQDLAVCNICIGA